MEFFLYRFHNIELNKRVIFHFLPNDDQRIKKNK
jgi:hypothetical protein